jgi:methionine synthase II (cobalamin-independent)
MLETTTEWRQYETVFPALAASRLDETNCGMAPLDHALAFAKLKALVAGTALVRHELGASR